MVDFLTAGPFTAHDGEGRLLFQDAEMRLPEGTAVVLDGPSGCGKSRFLRHVVGLDAARVGARSLAGERYSGRGLSRWRGRVTLLAQDAPMVPGTVGENLELPFRLGCSGDRRFDSDLARELMSEVGLERLALDRDVGRLSGGERHRLALVRGLLWDPPVLAADEPLSGLDSDAASACFELLLGFAHRDGHVLLAVLHDRGLGRRADLSLRLADGRLEET